MTFEEEGGWGAEEVGRILFFFFLSACAMQMQ